MLKPLLNTLAALLFATIGFASGSRDASSRIKLSNNYLVDLQNYLNFEMQVDFDVGYGTNYRQYLDPADSDLQQTSYDFNIDSKLKLTFNFEVLKFYTYKMTTEVIILNFMPYRQNITWVRPEALIFGSKKDFDL